MITPDQARIVSMHFGRGGSKYANDLGVKVYDSIRERGLSALPIESTDIFLDMTPEQVIDYFVPQRLTENGVDFKETRYTMPVYTVRGSRGEEELYIGFSSGTTREDQVINIPWLESTFESAMDWFGENFQRYGIPKGRNIFAYATGGLFQEAMVKAAGRMNGEAFVDFPKKDDGTPDVGNIKKKLAGDEREATVRHLLDTRINPMLASAHNIGTIATLPPILEALDAKHIQGIDAAIIAAFGVSHEKYFELKERYAKQGKIFAECYGNILWTWAFGDDSRGHRDFFPPPFVIFEVAEPETDNMLHYYQRGQVVATRYTPELLVRWREGDGAVKILPREPFGRDGVRDVGRMPKV